MLELLWGKGAKLLLPWGGSPTQQRPTGLTIPVQFRITLLMWLPPSAIKKWSLMKTAGQSAFRREHWVRSQKVTPYGLVGVMDCKGLRWVRYIINYFLGHNFWHQKGVTLIYFLLKFSGELWKPNSLYWVTTGAILIVSKSVPTPTPQERYESLKWCLDPTYFLLFPQNGLSLPWVELWLLARIIHIQGWVLSSIWAQLSIFLYDCWV